MEQVAMVHATVNLVIAVAATEPIDEDDIRRRLAEAINHEAAQFIVCAERPPGEIPAWMGTINRLDVSFDRLRIVYTDVTT